MLTAASLQRPNGPRSAGGTHPATPWGTLCRSAATVVGWIHGSGSPNCSVLPARPRLVQRPPYRGAGRSAHRRRGRRSADDAGVRRHGKATDLDRAARTVRPGRADPDRRRRPAHVAGAQEPGADRQAAMEPNADAHSRRSFATTSACPRAAACGRSCIRSWSTRPGSSSCRTRIRRSPTTWWAR